MREARALDLARAPPWRSAIARTIASPRPEPSPRARRAAPEALERALGLRGREAGALVGDATIRARSPVARRPSTVIAPPGGPCLRALRDEVARRARSSAGRSPRTGTGVRRRRTSTSGVLGRRARELGEVDAARRGGRGGVLAREREQVVEQRAEPRGVGLEVGEHRRVGAVARDVGGVAAQRGERRAQLVRGVADEAPLGLARALERGEHRVERLGQLADLVAARAARAAARAASPAALDRARAGRQARQRPQRAAREEGGEQRGERGGRERARRARAGACVVERRRRCRAVVPATITAPPPPAPRPSSPSGAA